MPQDSSHSTQPRAHRTSRPPPPTSTEQSVAHTTTRTQGSETASSSSDSSYLRALRQIDDIAVTDLAATLTNPGEDDVDEDNITFLRTPVDPQDEWRAQNADTFQEHRNRIHTMSRAADLGRDDRQRRERLQRVLQRLNRLHDPAYGDRVPSHNSLYDWSPASEGEDEELELENISQDIRATHPNTHPEVLRVLAQTQLEERRSGRQSSSRFLTNSSSQNDSLRSAAILQAVRRHPRFSARSREYMQRFVMDRADRWSLEGDEESSTGWPEENTRPIVALPPVPPRDPPSSGPYHSTSNLSSTSSSRPHMRRSQLQDPTCNTTTDPSTEWLGQTITYLAKLRNCETYEDSLGHAVDARFVTKEFFSDKHDDFVDGINSIPPTFETSLLAPGTVLEGQQRANPDIASHNSTLSRSQDWRWESSNPSSREHSSNLGLDGSTSARDSNVPPHAQRARRPITDKYYTPDSWPVRVTIHAVDYEKMTIAATMEAYDVPSHPPDLISTIPLVLESSASRPPTIISHDIPKKKSITTYLEGEIIDFRTHTLLTESFASTPVNDATYWRKLEPFRHLTTDQIVRSLVSKTFHAELSKSYILMRWKERCFVRDGRDAKGSHRNNSEDATPPERNSSMIANGSRVDGADWYDSAEMADGCGLTISGFYYVCLRRGDGGVEGLYCDPHSSPYQHLTLERQQKFSQFPAWSFK
ncbi:hypothetical protein EJ08DRAFT_731896 [Tothia fuscella]|uniref:Vacuolar import and degradation protein-domain-containing protein n=1 Tax=Tothia fuscella TaxID=1048955 RepID=A0A9P4NWV5_9PEZI|nr:hypothetical protein EJ08DRAFT_731896 [Tothia fuscella]